MAQKERTNTRLWIGRKWKQSILIGQDIKITVLRNYSGSTGAKILIEAPAGTPINRWEKLEAELQKAIDVVVKK